MNDKVIQEGRGEPEAEHAQNCSPAPKWAALVDDEPIPMPRQLVKVGVIKAQAEIPPNFVLVRDYDSPDDTVLADGETVDLAKGNVFYRLAACDVKPRGQCSAPPKLALIVDDRAEVTINPHQTGKSIRELFGFKDDVLLFRDFESPRDESISLEEAAPFDKGPVFYTRRQHTQLEIIVNNKRFTEAEGVKHHMTGLQIAALVSDNPRNTEVFRLLKKGEPEPVPLDKEICIENCDEFRVVRNNVAGGFVEPTRIERELEKLKQGGCRVDFIQQPFPAVIYRDVPTRPGYRHLQMTDVLVIVPGGYPGQPLDGAHLPEGSPLLGRVAGSPQGLVVADGRRWQLVSYHPHNGGGASPWNKDKHGLPELPQCRIRDFNLIWVCLYLALSRQINRENWSAPAIGQKAGEIKLVRNGASPNRHIGRSASTFVMNFCQQPCE
ncbi:MAG: hypothetical protein ABSG80_05650 [Verrucomicrobiota bacterium]|jgi:hypothetical protein